MFKEFIKKDNKIVKYAYCQNHVWSNIKLKICFGKHDPFWLKYEISKKQHICAKNKNVSYNHHPITSRYIYLSQIYACNRMYTRIGTNIYFSLSVSNSKLIIKNVH